MECPARRVIRLLVQAIGPAGSALGHEITCGNAEFVKETVKHSPSTHAMRRQEAPHSDSPPLRRCQRVRRVSDQRAELFPGGIAVVRDRIAHLHQVFDGRFTDGRYRAISMRGTQQGVRTPLDVPESAPLDESAGIRMIDDRFCKAQRRLCIPKSCGANVATKNSGGVRRKVQDEELSQVCLPAGPGREQYTLGQQVPIWKRKRLPITRHGNNTS